MLSNYEFLIVIVILQNIIFFVFKVLFGYERNMKRKKMGKNKLEKKENREEDFLFIYCV